jgi:hypothetical protein
MTFFRSMVFVRRRVDSSWLGVGFNDGRWLDGGCRWNTFLALASFKLALFSDVSYTLAFLSTGVIQLAIFSPI